MKIDPCSKGSWLQECVTGISEGPRLRTKMLGLLVQVGPDCLDLEFCCHCLVYILIRLTC